MFVVGRHTSPGFQIHPFGMAEFLRRLLREPGFEDETISVVLPETPGFEKLTYLR